MTPENPAGWRGPLLAAAQAAHLWSPDHQRVPFGETKATGWWLKNLPPLEPTNIVPEREQRVHRMAPGPDRWRERSRTFPGIAAAMAAQWGSLAIEAAA